MKNRFFYCLLAAATLAISTASAEARAAHPVTAAGPVLWHGVRAGMREAQVRAVLPDLAKDKAGDDFHANPTQVAGQSFDVHVFMLGGRVARVSLIANGAVPSMVVQALNAKFGQPETPYDCEMVAVYMCKGDWRAPGGVTVSLLHSVFDRGSQTEVRYEAPDTGGL